MDRSAPARKRNILNPARHPATLPNHALGASPHAPPPRPTPLPRSFRAAKDSSEITRAKWTNAWDPDDADSNAQHFTVANVGAGGTLYLRPSRLPHHHFTVFPATPPATSDGRDPTRGPAPNPRLSDLSGVWTPNPRASLNTHTPPVPPLSLANGLQRRRARSHSFSTIGDHSGPNALNAGDFKLPGSSNDRLRERPRSSIDLGDGLIHLRIPHYRLGTPRFSERGTAYLHNSIFSSVTDDQRSSAFSHSEYDRLFPLPPGAAPGRRAWPREHSSSPYLHPSDAYSRPRTRSTTPLGRDDIPSARSATAIFDTVEAAPNDPSTVRFSPETGRIVAATVPRLIVQLTSPRFLDYELLSDFFLTFRCFVSCHQLLEWLLLRMKWAIANASDAGRIVRVRTFVALRHWILNYFGDDFLPDLHLRQRFCDNVNHLAFDLARRPDRGGSDLNIVGELKKCWRRTSALFWPVSNPMDPSADTDIVPGGERIASAFTASNASLPLPLRQDWTSDSNQAAAAAAAAAATSDSGTVPQTNRYSLPSRPASSIAADDFAVSRARKSSVTASPMSEDSLQILSCSIPFLQHVRADSKAERRAQKSAPRPVMQQRRPSPPARQHTDAREGGHQRSGNYEDPRRDDVAPVSLAKPATVDAAQPSDVAIIGGLVRGLLLQPQPPTLAAVAPQSPALGPLKFQEPLDEEAHLDDRATPHTGVKRIVGDVRRALSTKKANSESSARSHQSRSSSGSRGSSNLRDEVKPRRQPSEAGMQRLQSLPKHDALAARIEMSYRARLQTSSRAHDARATSQQVVAIEKELDGPVSGHPSDHHNRNGLAKVHRGARLDSHITAASRSIVIVDDTQTSGPALSYRALPSVSTTSGSMTPLPLFGDASAALALQREGYFPGVEFDRSSARSDARRTRDHRSIDGRLHESFSFPGPHAPQTERETHDPAESELASKEPGMPASASDVRQIPNQLRRRPGGDLKAADHVHELAPLQRPDTADSWSPTARSFTRWSAVDSHDLSGTHFSDQAFRSRLDGPSVHGRHGSGRSLDSRVSWSQPHARPSFQADAEDLTRVPERASGGGGVEDALMKLEGKTMDVRRSDAAWLGRPAATLKGEELGDVERRLSQATAGADAEFGPASPMTETQGASIFEMSRTDLTDFATRTEPGPADGKASAPFLAKASMASRFPDRGRNSPASSTKSVTFVDKAVERDSETAPHAEGRKKPASSSGSSAAQGSFLLDDDESLSDISTEMAEDQDEQARSFFFFEDPAAADDGARRAPAAVKFDPPPTPPSTVGANPDDPAADEMTSAPKLLGQDAPSKSAGRRRPPFAKLRRARTSPEEKGEEEEEQEEEGEQPQEHTPFVLGFGSEVLAEQLTIIEKDALDEVDWKDLIALQWQQAPARVRDWVEYVLPKPRDDDDDDDNYEQPTAAGSGNPPNGIDLVIARFNLVVKWVVSTVVLTASAGARARCVAKFIHVAAHCRRLRNYASTYQLTLALLSSDLARLRETWSLVAAPDRATLARLETLCRPVRNFHNLRAEMEASAGGPPARGCIPFIGLYTHDLTYNAQKPARVETTTTTTIAIAGTETGTGPGGSGTAPLVNFERFQTAAAITKGLLRLLEASSSYALRPHPEALSRCLWLAALDDAEIAERSKGLE